MNVITQMNPSSVGVVSIVAPDMVVLGDMVLVDALIEEVLAVAAITQENEALERSTSVPLVAAPEDDQSARSTEVGTMMIIKSLETYGTLLRKMAANILFYR